MKGQFVFEFLIAGLVFFTIVVYSINYLNMNVTNFKTNFYQSRLQSKAVQISEVLMKDASPLGLTDNSEFNLTKIQNFNSTYCNLTDPDSRENLRKDFYIYEKTVYGLYNNSVKILLINSNSGQTILDCGFMVPRNITRAEVGRAGVLGNDVINLRVVVW